MAPKIIQQVELQGQQQVAKGFDQIGASADKAALSINKVSGSKLGAAGASLTDVGKGARDAASGMGSLDVVLGNTGKSLGTTSAEAVKFGQILRLLGRASGTHELSSLGREIAVLGRIFAVAAPALFAIALAKMASSAADAASAIADTAASVRLSVVEFQDLVAAQAAIGGSADDAGKTMKGLNTLIKDTATQNERNTATFKRLSDQITETRDRTAELARGYVHIRETAVKALEHIRDRQKKASDEAAQQSKDFVQQLQKIEERRKDIESGPPSEAEKKRRDLRDLDIEEANIREKQDKAAQESLDQIIKSSKEKAEVQKKEKEERRKLNNEIDQQQKKEQEATAALAKARREAELNATALDKLGVAYNDSNGKLIKGKAAILDIADAFSRVTDPAKQQEIEFDLIAAGFDRKLIPALRRGRQGYQDLIDAGKKLETPITDAQIKSADDFKIAIGQLGVVVGDFFTQLGLAAAPAFTQFLQELVKLIVANKQELIDFAKQVGTVLLPVLQELGNVLKLLITFIGDFERGINTISNGIQAASAKIREFLGLKAKVDKPAVKEAAPVAAGESITGATGIGKAAQLAKTLEKNANQATVAVKQLNTEANKPIEPIIRLPTEQEFNNLKTFAQKAFAGIVTVANELWTQLQAKFAEGADIVSRTWDAIKQGAVAKFNEIIQTVQDFWNDLIAKWEAAKAAFTWENIKAAAQSAWDGVVQVFADAVQFLQEKWNSFIDWFVDKIKTGIAWAQKLLGISTAAGAAGSAQTAGAKGAARGWYVRGPGTTTSDSIPALLSDKEYVNRAAAVRKYGVGLFNALNTLQLPKDFFQGFAAGGLASFGSMRMRPMRFAGGGSATSSMRALNLTIGADTFAGLLAPEDVAQKLIKVATHRQMSSAGRKPAYYGRNK